MTQLQPCDSPDDVIVLRISASEPIGLGVVIDDGTVVDGDIVKTGSASGEYGTRYEGRVRVVADGTTSAGQNGLDVSDSREITIYVAAATDFNREIAGAQLVDGWQQKARQDLDAVQKKRVEFVERAAVEVGAGSFAVMLLTIGVNVWVMRYESRRGRELRSAVLSAEALHTKSNVLYSLGVLAGMLLTPEG